MLVILVFQLCFMLANCRHEILSYDKPQDATRDERADTEISDNTHDILVIDDDTVFDYSDEVQDDKVTVDCLQNNMVIAIPKTLLRGADREHIRALDVDCQASENLTHFFLDVPLTGCGTKSRHANSSVIYSNEALPVPAMAEDVVSHVPDFRIPFHCYYDSEGLVTGVGLMPRSKKVVLSQKGFGKFTLKLDLYPDIRFVGPYTQDDFPVTKKLSERIYFEASVDTIDHRLTILARDCYATPNPETNSSPKYWIIQNGCKLDETLEYHPANKKSERFSLKSFTFIGEHAFVFVHCHVRICNVSDPDSKCVRVCEDRRKRDVSFASEDLGDVYPLAQGPLALQKEEATREKKAKTSDPGLNVPVIATLAAVIALCLICASYMIWQRKKLVDNYTTLAQEIQN